MKSFFDILFSDKYRSLFYRLSAALALSVVLVGLGIFLFNSAYNHLQRQSKLDDLSAQARTLFKNYYNNLFQDMDKKSIDLANNKKLLNILKDSESDGDLSLIDVINGGADFCCMVSIDVYTRDRAFRYNHGLISDIPPLSDAQWQAGKADVREGTNWKLDDDASGTAVSPPVVHILRSLPNIATEPYGFIKINLNSQSLFQNPYGTDRQERMWLVTPASKLFSLSTGLLDQSAMADEPRFVSDSPEPVRIGGASYLTYTMPAQLAGWSFVYAVPEGRVAGGTYIDSPLLFTVLLLFMLLVVYTFFLIRSVFGKIRTIQEVVGSSSDAAGTKGASFSLDVLINNVASLKEHRENIEWLYRKNIPILKKALCYRLLYHDRGEWPDIQDQMAQLGISFPSSQFSVILLRIDRYYDFLQTYNKADQSLLRFFIYKMAEEMGGQSLKALLWNSESRDIVMIVNAADPMEEAEFKTHLESVVLSIVQQINGYLKMTVTAAIGHPIQDARHIPDCWNRVVNFMDSQRFGGSHVLKVWDQDGEAPIFSDMLEASRRRKDALLQAVKSNDKGQIDEELDRTTSFLESLDGYPMMFVQQLLIDSVMSVAYALMEMGSKLRVEAVFAEMHLELQRFESIQDAVAWVRRKLSEWLDGMEDNRSDHADLISHVLEYVKANYDREISLGGIAGELRMNMAHLSRLFKKSTGQNFMDYLIDLRIERAKQMLTDSSETVQSIGEKVGYVNTQSFIRIFKKNVGATPGQYRDSRAEEAEKRLDTGKIY